MNISKGTIVRTILLVIAVVNMGLKYFGYDVITADETGISDMLEYLIDVAIVIVGFWKNNSYTEKAITADEFLKKLKEED